MLLVVLGSSVTFSKISCKYVNFTRNFKSKFDLFSVISMLVFAPIENTYFIKFFFCFSKCFVTGYFHLSFASLIASVSPPREIFFSRIRFLKTSLQFSNHYCLRIFSSNIELKGEFSFALSIINDVFCTFFVTVIKLIFNEIIYLLLENGPTCYFIFIVV